MQGLLFKSSTEKLEHRKQRLRAIVLISVTSVIVIIALFEYYYSNYRNTQSAAASGGTATIINTQGTTAPVASYDFYTPYSKNRTTYRGKLPPTHYIVTALSPLEAIEMFAERYSLTVDSVQNNNVTYITPDGFQFNTQVKLAKKPSSPHS